MSPDFKWREAEELAGRAEFAVIPASRRNADPAAACFAGNHLAGFPFGVSSKSERGVRASRLNHRPAAVAEFIPTIGFIFEGCFAKLALMIQNN